MVMIMTKNKPVFVRVELQDQRVVDWYRSLPERGKSLAVTQALALGISVAEDELDLMKQIIAENDARISDFENWSILVRNASVKQAEDVKLVTQRLDKFDEVLAQAQEIIEANKLSFQTSG